MRRNRSNRPSLIGTAARTAVVVGTATAVAGAVGGSSKSAPPPQAAAPQPVIVAPAGPDKLTQLQQLAELQKTGVLNEQEFEKLKADILAG